MNNGLTEKQRAYCRERAKGKTRAEAWKDAGYGNNPSTQTAARNALHLEKDRACSKKIRAEIARLRALADQDIILDRKQRQAKLTEIFLDDKEKTDNRLRAVDMLNRMGGDYTENVRSESVNKVQLTYEEKKKLFMEEMTGEE